MLEIYHPACTGGLLSMCVCDIYQSRFFLSLYVVIETLCGIKWNSIPVAAWKEKLT